MFTDLNFLGFEISEKDWDAFTRESQTWESQYDLVAVCGSLPRGVTPEQFAAWLEKPPSTRLKSGVR